MRRHLGRLSAAGAVASWSTLVVALVSGGLDPSPAQAPRLQAVMAGALCIAALALVAAVVAVVRGPDRIWAMSGLVLALAFLVLFTGFGFPR
jgi:hypothetical protein